MITLGPKDALIVIDPQNDFLKDGALAVADGNAILDDINFLSIKFFIAGATIVMTQDWHPKGHKSFASTHYLEPLAEIDMPYGKQTLWPDHCIQGTKGAEFHPKVDGAVTRASLIVRKGMNTEIDSYSAFLENDKVTSTGLAGYLRDKGIERCFFVGLAYDFCVGYSAIDAVKLGFEAVVIKDLTRSIGAPIPLALTDGHPSTTIDLIESEFDVNNVALIRQDEFFPIKQQA